MASSANNTKDITIRFTGENLLGPVARSVQSELDGLVRKYQNAAKITTAEVAKRAIAQRDAWMKPFMEFEKASVKGWVRFGSAAEAAFNRAGAAAQKFNKEVANRAFAGVAIGAGMAGDVVGGTAGQAIGAVGSIAGQASLGGMVGGPFGAAIFGTVAALKTFKSAIDEASQKVRDAEAWGKRQQTFAVEQRRRVSEEAKALRQQFVPDQPLTAKQARGEMAEKLEAQRNFLNKTIGLTPEQRNQAAAEFKRTQAELLHFDRGLAVQSFEKLGGNLQAFGGGAKTLFDRVRGSLGGAAGGLADTVRGGLSETAERSRRMLAQSSPAAGLRSELGELQQQLQGGQISPEAFNAARQRLRMQAIGQLPGMQQTPNLAATEGRFITMGRRNELKDEFSAYRREFKMLTEKHTSQLVAAIRESGGTTDSL